MPPKQVNREGTSKRRKANTPPPASTSEQDPNGPIFFWREHSNEYSYLSQWYNSPFTAEDEDITYGTAEQYMMYQKAILFNDLEVAQSILETINPKEQKALGRKVKNFKEETWLANRERIVEEGNYYKFLNGRGDGEGLEGEAPALRDKLLATGDREIVEASPMDRIWGIGFGAKNAESRREKWGLNLLGKAIVKARDAIRAEMDQAE